MGYDILYLYIVVRQFAINKKAFSTKIYPLLTLRDNKDRKSFLDRPGGISLKCFTPIIPRDHFPFEKMKLSFMICILDNKKDFF